MAVCGSDAADQNTELTEKKLNINLTTKKKRCNLIID
jgi:hypothetical protein